LVEDDRKVKKVGKRMKKIWIEQIESAHCQDGIEIFVATLLNNRDKSINLAELFTKN